MRKEENQEKSPKSNEGEEIGNVKKERQLGRIGFCILFCIVIVINLFTSQNNYIVCSLLLAYITVETYGRYSVTKKKSVMWATVLEGMISLLFLVFYILSLLGFSL